MSATPSKHFCSFLKDERWLLGIWNLRETSSKRVVHGVKSRTSWFRRQGGKRLSKVRGGRLAPYVFILSDNGICRMSYTGKGERNLGQQWLGKTHEKRCKVADGAGLWWNTRKPCLSHRSQTGIWGSPGFLGISMYPWNCGDAGILQVRCEEQCCITSNFLHSSN